jgi:dolichol-phosphate mannosyltransferase
VAQSRFELDVVIPVYNEGENIVPALDSLREYMQTPARILICYDHDTDTTLSALEGYDASPHQVVFTKNERVGALGAVLTGMKKSVAPYVLVFPADDDYNAARLDKMVAKARAGCDIVCASRFIKGGSMVGCPKVKAFFVRSAAFTLYHFARIPTRDATNGFRLFSSRVVHSIPIESEVGFAYSLELLAKAHRLGWPIGEVPVNWYERNQGESRFRIYRWLPQYLRWYFYAFATTWFRRPPESVRLTSHTLSTP